MDPRWAYMSVFVFDVNTLGVVHVPHLRKPNGRGRWDGAPRARRAARPRRARRREGRPDSTSIKNENKDFLPASSTSGPSDRQQRCASTRGARVRVRSQRHTHVVHSKRQVRSADLRSPALSYPSAHPCSAYICGWGLPTLRRQRPVCGPLGPHTHLRVGPGAYTGALTWAHLAADPDGALNGRLGQSSSSGPTRGVRALLGRRRRPPCPAVSLDRPRCMFFTERHPGRLSCGCNARRGAE